MSKADRQKKRLRKGRYAKPSPPGPYNRAVNDNHPAAVNDNLAPVSIKGVALTDGQLRRYYIALRNIEQPGLEVQRAGHVVLETIEREIDAVLAERHAAEGIEERRGLEALRGLEIGRSDVEGAKGAPRLHVDGLETLWSSKAITTNQRAAGLRYRLDYERIDPEKQLTPPEAKDVRHGYGGEGWDDKRREIEERVFRVKLMICGIDNLPGSRGALPNLPKGHPAMRAIYALDEVAGKGRIIAYMSESGSVRARIRDDLIFALEACEIVYGIG